MKLLREVHLPFIDHISERKAHIDGEKGTHNQKDPNIKMTRIIIESKNAIQEIHGFVFLS